MTRIQDDRSPEQQRTHPLLIIGTDRVLSGWGGAAGGASYAAWACRPEERTPCLTWVEERRDMKRVREAGPGYRPGRGCAHLHVYVFRPIG